MMQALFSISGVAMACASVMPSTTTNSSRGSSNNRLRRGFFMGMLVLSVGVRGLGVIDLLYIRRTRRCGSK